MIVSYGFGVYDWSLFLLAWDECIELQVRSKDDWACAVGEELAEAETYKVHIERDGRIVGALVLAPDDDIHVGRCLSVIFSYVIPEYRCKDVGFNLYRLAHHLAKVNGYSILAYTHRLSPWNYKTTYRRIHGEENDAEDRSS